MVQARSKLFVVSGQEPERLKDIHEELLEKTRSLAFKHYRTFIEAAECSREIYKDVCTTGDGCILFVHLFCIRLTKVLFCLFVFFICSLVHS